jgi:hypothetical protein
MAIKRPEQEPIRIAIDVFMDALFVATDLI